MATFRKKRSKSYRSKNTRRNTRRSRIKRQGKKSLVSRAYRGGTFDEKTIEKIELWINAVKAEGYTIEKALQSMEKSDDGEDEAWAGHIRKYLADQSRLLRL